MISPLIFFEFLVSLFDAVLCVYFISEFNGASLSFKKNIFAIPAIAVIFVFSVINDLFLSGFNILGTVIFLCLYISYALLISQKRYMNAILSACIFEIIFVLLSSLIFLILSFVIKDYESLVQGSCGVFRYLYLTMHKIILFVVLKIILNVFNKQEKVDLKEGIISFAFSLVTVLGLGSAMYIVSLSPSTKIQTQAIIITVSFIFTNIALYVLIYQTQKHQRDKYELSLLQEKIAFEEARHSNATLIWSNIRKIQHDINHHLTVISGYADSGDLENCKKYINNLSLSTGIITNLITSENKVLDYLINSKLGNLKDTKIVISGSIGDLSDINDTDLVCLIGNILDNAVDAINKVKKANDKRIELLFLRQNSNRIIICKNTVEKSVLSCNKELKSTKQEKTSHGLGTKIIAKIVSDYCGMVDYFEEFNMFGVQVILPEPRQI